MLPLVSSACKGRCASRRGERDCLADRVSTGDLERARGIGDADAQAVPDRKNEHVIAHGDANNLEESQAGTHVPRR